MNLKKIFVPALVLFALGHQNLAAQMYLISTKSNHGGLFLGDSDEYSYNLMDKELYRIEYICFHAFKDDGDDGIRDTKILQIGSKFSKFVTKVHFQMDSTRLYTSEHFFSIDGLNEIDPVFVYECYYTDLASRELTFTNLLWQDDLLYEETLSEIKWELSTESTVTICGLQCTKATGTFRGRSYTAWFTPDIPSPAGPWKLGGLPGVILKHQTLLVIVHSKPSQ